MDHPANTTNLVFLLARPQMALSPAWTHHQYVPLAAQQLQEERRRQREVHLPVDHSYLCRQMCFLIRL